MVPGEQPKRATYTYEALHDAGFTEKCVPLPANFCKEESLALVHHPEYLKIAKKDTKSGRSTLSTGDTQICEDSWDISLRATGGLLHALDQIFAGKMDGPFHFPDLLVIMQPHPGVWDFVFLITSQ